MIEQIWVGLRVALAHVFPQPGVIVIRRRFLAHLSHIYRNVEDLIIDNGSRWTAADTLPVSPTAFATNRPT